MFRNLRLMPSFKNMSATGGVTTVLELPRGEIFHSLKIKLTNITHANCTDIKYLINNRVVQEYATGTMLQAINDTYGRPSDSGHLTLHFERPEMQEALEQVTSIGTSNIQEHRVEITLASGLTSAAISAYAEVTAPRTPQEGQLGWITMVKKILLQTASGEQDIVDEITRGDPIMAIHFGVNDITDVKVIADSRVIYEASKTIAAEFAEAYGRVYSSSYTSLHFCLRGRHDDALVTARFAADGTPLIQDLIWRITDTSGGQVPVYVEYLRDTSKGL